MLIHTEISAHYDWVPCPPGTEITEADIKALRVKKMTDDSWHMRVECKRDTTNDVNIPESAICDRMASLVAIGKPESREEVVAFILKGVYHHHLNPKKIKAITVHDDGPNVEMFQADLTRLGVTDERFVEATESYQDQADIQQYLNVVFKVKGKK